MVTRPPFGVMPLSAHPAGTSGSVTVQLTPTGMSKAAELASVAGGVTVKVTSRSYAAPGSQSTCAVKVVEAPAGAPTISLVMRSCPIDRRLVTVTATGSGPSVTVTCPGVMSTSP